MNTLIKAIKYFIGTFLAVYDTIVPFDAQKSKNGKTHRKLLRVLLIAYFLLLCITKTWFIPLYQGIVVVSSCVVAVLILLSVRRYNREDMPHTITPGEQINWPSGQQFYQTQSGKRKKRKRHKNRTSQVQTSQNINPGNMSTGYEYSYEDDEDESGISDSAGSAEKSQDNQTAGNDDTSPWDDFAIGDVLYGLPFNPNKRK